MKNVRSGEELKNYRASYNYRAEYFKRNPGLFGHIWFCSQCYKPLFGKKNVVIDHIIPLAKGGPNRVSNCTAICRKCNLAKSDKIDGRVIKGSIFKIFESTTSGLGRGIGGAVGLTAGLTAGAFVGTAKLGKGLIGGVFSLIKTIIKTFFVVITLPLRKGTILSRLLFASVYIAAGLYCLMTYTTLLDCWLL